MLYIFSREVGPGTNFEAAFKVAYDLFLNTEEAGTGSGCENIIIFITDGTSPE